MAAAIKYVEKALTVAAGGAWALFSSANRMAPRRAFTPAWSDLPLLKSHERTKPPLGWPRETDSLCPGLRPRGPLRHSRRACGLPGAADREGRRNPGDDSRAGGAHPDGEGVSAPRTVRGRHGDRSGLLQTSGRRVPRARHPRACRRAAAQPWQQHHRVRARLCPDRRPDEPLQHDVRSVLHGREPGGLRPRAHVGRDPDAARQRRQHQAAPADVRAVLGRRADAVAPLPRGDSLRPPGRIPGDPGRDQRHRVRQEPGVRQGVGGSGPALRLPAVRRDRQRRQRAPPGAATCST